MTDLNNEVRELNIDELDEVSGGLLWCRPGPGYPIGTAASYAITVGQLMSGYPTGEPEQY
jgi:hypothetical protein